MAYSDIADQRRYAKAHYEANKSAYKARADAYTRAQRIRLRILVDASKDVPCPDCGGRFSPWVMDFDHVRGVKLFDIGDAVNRAFGITKVKTEMAKCEVVCANCHRDRTHRRRLAP